MIVLLEPVCSSWIHEEANAGFLQLVCKHYSGQVTFIAEKEHIHCIRNIYMNDDINYVKIKNPVKKDDSDDYIHIYYYLQLLKAVVLKYRPEKLFILCAYRPCMLAAELIALRFFKMEINIILHGMIEKSKGHFDSYRRIFYLSTFCKKLRFITYSPYCSGGQWNIGKDKFVFIDQCYTDQSIKYIRKKKKKKVIIGIVGACANEKAKKIITFVNQHPLNMPYEFWVASKYGVKFRHIDHVKVVDLEFDRKKKEEMLQQFDYLLIPYDQQEYALSASGVLWDAISSRVPCFMLGSYYFKYYMKYKVGYQADNIKDLCKMIFEKIQRPEDEDPTLFVNLDSIQQRREETIKLLLRSR